VLSASAHSYALLLGARLGSALAQALFVAVASQVAMAAVPPVRQTAAVARVFNGFALATVIGLPAGTFVGQLYGWHAAFVLVALLSAAGLAGILIFCPAIPQAGADPLAHRITVMLRPTVLLGLLTTMLALTGFVAAFTYVAPTLREVAGLPDVGVTLALLVYGAGTIAGTALAGRIQPAQIARVLPLPLASLAVVLVTQGLLMQQPATAAVSLFLMGGSAFVVVPLLQTWLMGEVGPAAAGIAAAMNISVAGLAAAVGASLGAAVIATGLGLAWIGPVASALPLAAMVTALAIRRAARHHRQQPAPPAEPRVGAGRGPGPSPSGVRSPTGSVCPT
jgi:DHA1 family inner membrane transport protein